MGNVFHSNWKIEFKKPFKIEFGNPKIDLIVNDDEEDSDDDTSHIILCRGRQPNRH